MPPCGFFMPCRRSTLSSCGFFVRFSYSYDFIHLKGVKNNMTFHVFFLTITIQKTRLSEEELEHKQHVQQIVDEVKDRQISFYNHL